jgi:hypothetical protein
MNDEGMRKPALTGGVLLGVLSSIPILSMLNCACCAWVIAGGLLASYLYVKASPVPVTLGRGVALGLWTGVVGTVVNALFMIPIHFLFSRMSLMEQVRQVLDQIPDVPPQTREMFRNLAAQGNMDIIIIVVALVTTLIINCLFAMLGGTIGVAVFEKRKKGGGPPDPSSYQPPVQLPPV